MEIEAPINPYEKLYIFEVEGNLQDVEFPEDFLGCWVEGPSSFMFFTTDHEEDVERLLSARGMELRSKTEMDYSDWEAGRRVKHIRVGRFLVCPLWDVVEPGPGDLQLLLEPGVAFGTGWHQTTNACLELIQKVFETNPPKTVLDLGTGTGILSIAALLLGAEHAKSIDYNQVSLTNAKKNIVLNKVADKVQLLYGDALAHIGEPADFLMANLYFDLLDRLLADPRIRTYPRMLFSGILSEFVDPFLAKIAEAGIRVVETRTDYGWYTFLTEF